ncbi:MAG: hypothetical protein QOK15_1043 [Nocardioidaceae bacterium]|nr:hypothetical protein [Nocardioidaceae bacterium]
MSAQHVEHDVTHDLGQGPGHDSGLDGDDLRGPGHEHELTPESVEIRRNAVLSAVIGAAASAMAIAYLWRAVSTGAVLDWTLCLLLGAMAAGFLRSLLDSRTPLFIADELGVRVRLGAQWRGLPWEAVDRVVVQPRRGVLHDGRVVVTLRNVQRAIESLEGRSRRHARLNQKLYGAALAVPLGLATRVSGELDRDLADRVATLSQGRAEVVTLLEPAAPAPTLPAQAATEPVERPVIADDEVRTTDRRPRWLRRSEGTGASEEVAEPGETAEDESQPSPSAPETGEVLRAGRPDEPAEPGPLRVVGAVTPIVDEPPAPTVPQQSARPLEKRTSRVRAIARLGDPVAPLVIGDFEPEPAYDPVIGPELAAARTRVGLSVDELADRTRIRPHVIESIEVDDFAPCGGDFYARGHIRTLARVLGKDSAPMLEAFERRYATAPVNARRVFEAELATGMTGSRRTAIGGPNWALLVAAVLALVLVWSAVRLFAGDPSVTLENPPPVLNGSAGLGKGYDAQAPAAAQQVPTTVTAVTAGVHVQVRDGKGALIFEGDLAIGQSKELSVDPPVTVVADNGSALSVKIAGRDLGAVGTAASPATKVYQRPVR